MQNKKKNIALQDIDFTMETRVHIAGEHRSEVEGLSNDFNANTTETHIAFGVKRTGRGCSSGVERSVHIGKVRGSIPRTPTTSRSFKSIFDSGFADHFWNRVAVGAPAHCWPWRGSLNSDGYGQITVGGKYWTASRLALSLAYGTDVSDALACHRCDNPACCNPCHLYSGTKSDNERDKVARGRHNPACGERNHFARLTTNQVANIRRLFKQGMSNVAIGKMLGVHHSTISKIRTGQSWASPQESADG
jgi:hypothetical protein